MGSTMFMAVLRRSLPAPRPRPRSVLPANHIPCAEWMCVLRAKDAAGIRAWHMLPNVNVNGVGTMKQLFLATVSVLALSGTTRAADLQFKAPPYAAASAADWSGTYLGIQGGFVSH